MVLSDNIYYKTMLDDLNIFQTGDFLQKGSFHFAAGNILVVQDPEFRVAAFPSPFKVSFFILVETSTPVDYLLDSLRSLFNDNLHRFRITESVACDEGVFNMFLETVILKIRYARNAALRDVARSFALPLRAAGIEASVAARFVGPDGRETASFLDRPLRIEDRIRARNP